MMTVAKFAAVAVITIVLPATAAVSAERTLAFASHLRARSSALPVGTWSIQSILHHQLQPSGRNRPLSRTHLYRKFHDYAWDKLVPDKDARLDTVPDGLKSNKSPVKGAPEGTNVLANIRSISRFPFLATGGEDGDGRQALRLARSAFLETQSAANEAFITPMTIHVLNFVLFPSTRIKDVDGGGYLGLPIFGADIVSLPGNKHLVALDFQPVLPLNGDGDDTDSKGQKRSLFPRRYSHLDRKLASVHSKYQKSDSDSDPLLPWGGDIPPQAERFFSPYALWTRLSGDDAMDTVSTLVWEAYREYTDLYLELMNAVQSDVNAGKLELGKHRRADKENPVWRGQVDYLDYRRTNDPARPMLQRLYGNEWSESVIRDVLFPGI